MTSPWDPCKGLSDVQLSALSRFEELLSIANRKRNLISRASAGDIRARHSIHSLTIATRDFPAGASVVDWGTGGGLPGIPLAIRFPDVTFHLVDSTFKKTWTVERIRNELELSNVEVHCMRAEDWSTPIHYAVSRATAPLEVLWQWTERHLSPGVPGSRGAPVWRPGLIALKGGDLQEEITALKGACEAVDVETLDLYDLTGRGYLQEKAIVSIHRQV